MCQHCVYKLSDANSKSPGPEVIKLFSCSTQLSTKYILLISVRMPTIVGILTFISVLNKHLSDFKQETSLFVSILVFMSS